MRELWGVLPTRKYLKKLWENLPHTKIKIHLETTSIFLGKYRLSGLLDPLTLKILPKDPTNILMI